MYCKKLFAIMYVWLELVKKKKTRLVKFLVFPLGGMKMMAIIFPSLFFLYDLFDKQKRKRETLIQRVE